MKCNDAGKGLSARYGNQVFFKMAVICPVKNMVDYLYWNFGKHFCNLLYIWYFRRNPEILMATGLNILCCLPFNYTNCILRKNIRVIPGRYDPTIMFSGETSIWSESYFLQLSYFLFWAVHRPFSGVGCFWPTLPVRISGGPMDRPPVFLRKSRFIIQIMVIQAARR